MKLKAFLRRLNKMLIDLMVVTLIVVVAYDLIKMLKEQFE